MTAKLLLQLAALFGGLGVAIGAFGAHALHNMLERAGRLDTFETAVRYQFYHALALLAIGVLWAARPELRALGTTGILSRPVLDYLIQFSGQASKLGRH